MRTDGRAGRRSAKWFSYDLPVDGTSAMSLVVTYNSDNRRARSFEILVEGERVGEQALPQSSVSKFYDVRYAVPARFIGGKKALTVRFQATNGNEVAPVFAIRVVKN